MALLLFGATGSTGQKIMRMALADGREIVALVRSKAKLFEQQTKLGAEPEKLAALTVLEGSLVDPRAIDSAVLALVKKGNNTGSPCVVINVAGKRFRDSDKKPLTPTMLPLILDAMRKHGVKRYIQQLGGVTNVPATHGKNAGAFVDWVVKPLLKAFGGAALLNENQECANLLSAVDDIDWTATRPAAIVEKPSSGLLKGADPPSKDSVTFEDLARFTLDQAFSAQSTWVRRYPGVTY